MATKELPPPGPERPKHPTLQQLFQAEADVYCRNVMTPPQLIEILLKESGSPHSRGFNIPPTEAPFPLSREVGGIDILKTARNLGHYIQRGHLLLLWPDEVVFGQAEADEVLEAMRFAANPNQEGYTPPRDEEDVETFSDPKMLALAAANQPRNPRVIVLMNGLKNGSLKPTKVLQDLRGLKLSERDLQHVLANLTSGTEDEERVRQWVLTRFQHEQATRRVSGPPSTDAQQAALKAMAAAQNMPTNPNQGRQRVMQVDERALKPSGRVGG